MKGIATSCAVLTGLYREGYKRHAHKEAIERAWLRFLSLLFILQGIEANLLVEQQSHETLHVRPYDVPDVVPLLDR